VSSGEEKHDADIARKKSSTLLAVSDEPVSQTRKPLQGFVVDHDVLAFLLPTITI
jgi:hypothetical protein